VGAHRPEVVAERLTETLLDTAEQLQAVGVKMGSLADLLARLDAVVAQVVDVQQTARATAEAAVADEVEQRVAALEAALGLLPEDTATAVDPG
jgi:hypothetical protein